MLNTKNPVVIGLLIVGGAFMAGGVALGIIFAALNQGDDPTFALGLAAFGALLLLSGLIAVFVSTRSRP